MNYRLRRLIRSSHLLTLLGLACLLSLVIMQTLPVQASGSSGGNRDEFPGRRQGGGTHWIPPAPVP